MAARETKSGWLSLLGFIVALGGLMAVQFAWISVSFSIAETMEWSEAARQTAQFVGYPLTLFIASLVVLVIWPNDARIDPVELRAVDRQQLIATLLLALPLAVVIAAALKSAELVFPLEVTGGEVKISQLTLMLGIVVLPAISEEVLFRGWLGKRMVQWLGPAGGIVISSVCFGLFHFVPRIVIATFLLGLVLHWVYHRTGSLLLTIVLHGVNNALAFASESVSGVPWRLALVALVSCLLLGRVISGNSLSRFSWPVAAIWLVAFAVDFVRAVVL